MSNVVEFPNVSEEVKTERAILQAAYIAGTARGVALAAAKAAGVEVEYTSCGHGVRDIQMLDDPETVQRKFEDAYGKKGAKLMATTFRGIQMSSIVENPLLLQMANATVDGAITDRAEELDLAHVIQEASADTFDRLTARDWPDGNG